MTPTEETHQLNGMDLAAHPMAALVQYTQARTWAAVSATALLLGVLHLPTQVSLRQVTAPATPSGIAGLVGTVALVILAAGTLRDAIRMMRRAGRTLITHNDGLATVRDVHRDAARRIGRGWA